MVPRGEQTLLVSFQGRQVAVHSSVVGVLDGVRHQFRSMTTAEPSDVIAALVVGQNGNRYGLFERGHDLVVATSITNILEHVSFVVTARLVEAHAELLWFHAACAATERRTVIIAAPWGHGKSTLAAGLAARGWSLLSDDLVPIDPRAGIIHAFPRLPMVRQNSGRVLSRDELLHVAKTESAIVEDPGPRPVSDLGGLLFPTFGHASSTELVQCAPAAAALELLKHCRNFGEHRESAVRYVAELAERAPAFRLSYSNGERAAACVDHTMRAEAISGPA